METLDGAGKQQLAAEMLQRTLQPYQFIIMVLVVLLVIVAITQFPRCKPLDKEEHETKATIGETLRYLACNSRFRFGIMAQFFLCGHADGGLVFHHTAGLADGCRFERARRGQFSVIYAFVGFFLGKCLANILMKRFNENKVLIAYSVLGSLALVYVIGVHDMSASMGGPFRVDDVRPLLGNHLRAFVGCDYRQAPHRNRRRRDCDVDYRRRGRAGDSGAGVRHVRLDATGFFGVAGVLRGGAAVFLERTPSRNGGESLKPLPRFQTACAKS